MTQLLPDERALLIVELAIFYTKQLFYITSESIHSERNSMPLLWCYFIIKQIIWSTFYELAALTLLLHMPPIDICVTSNFASKFMTLS